MTLTVSVVIATIGRAGLVADLVASISNGDELPAEILVVDQSRDEPTREALGGLDGVTLVPSPRQGLSAARNHGARRAQNDVVVFCDDDIRVTPGWLRALVQPVSSEEKVVATGRVERDPQDTGGIVPALVLETEPAAHTTRGPRDVLAGGNMAIRKADLEAVGGFDERLGPGSRFPAAEDNDLALRLLTSGFTIRYEPAALVYHRAWRRSASYPVVRWRYGRGKGAFYAKNSAPGDRYGRQRAAADLGVRARRLPTVLHRPIYAAGEVLYAAGVVVGGLEWLLRERR
jgi:GT2 family glycosyltransferase